jgi:hypothetical protein
MSPYLVLSVVLFVYAAGIAACPIALAAFLVGIALTGTDSGKAVDRFLTCLAICRLTSPSGRMKISRDHTLASTPSFHRDNGAPQGARRSNDELLRLHHEEEHQAA